jgi:undecaprenyl phosphate-alpha-L-ara4FN deformylase
MIVGLRIDLDTWRGTSEGVPELCRILADRSLTASFFFSLGPDNMGRHLWRLLQPAFLWKMLRSRSASLYGWDILLRGTFWPGPCISERAPEPIRAAGLGGHEIGFHAWDHHAWQVHVDGFSTDRIRELTSLGVQALERITGARPVASAAAGWRCNEQVLRAQEGFDFDYQSDCRGESLFLPLVEGRPSDRLQIPVTLPTYDELIGRDGVRDSTFNAELLSRLDPAGLNVLTVHAEVEGGSRKALFVDFLERALAVGWSFVPLGRLVPEEAELPVAPLVSGRVAGRAGQLARQG